MRICVFCSSKLEFDPSTIEACRALARWMAQRGHTLVYGGAQAGLMGLMADEVLGEGALAIGYLPKDLFPSEVPHRNLTKLVEVQDLFERKKLMMENSDAFIILPGGVGTLDEFFEVLTWKSLDCFDKPILVYNVNGFWNSLLQMMQDLEEKKVLAGNLRGCFEICTSLREIEEML
jgi:uncharacterized protein (TIGR00730 family)